MLFVRLAWRNILRNRRRTALTVLAIAIGVGALVMTWALFDGSNKQAINNMTDTFTGHVQIHRLGYTDDPGLEKTFRAAEVNIEKLQAIPGVTSITPRFESPVLISTNANSRGIVLIGVDPIKEPSVTSLQKKLIAGAYLTPGNSGILLGTSLAKTLKVSVGGEVAVLTQGMYGSIGAAKYSVAGIYDTGNEMVDSMQAFITLADAGALFSSEGMLTTLAIKLENYNLTDGATSQMSQMLPNNLEIKGWKQLIPDVAQKVGFHEWMTSIVMIILFGIVMIGVTNTMLISVFERKREFGVMMSMGTSGPQIFRTIVYEGLLIGLLGFVAGLSVSYGLVAHLGSHGIDFSGHSHAVQTLRGVSNKLYPDLSLSRALFIGVTLIAITVAAAIYPALKTASLLPLDALRGLSGNIGSRGKGRGVSNRFLILALAFRNIARHPLRTSLTGFAVAFAMAAFIFLACFMTGYYRQIVDNATGFISGDGQIQHRDFKTELNPSLMLKHSAQLLNDLKRMPEIKAASPRVMTPAMVSSPAAGEPLLLMGVYPDQERQVTFLYRSVKEGSYLNPGHDREIVMGRKLAERLHVQLGDKVVVTAQDVNGNLASESLIVTGLFSTGSHGFDDSLAHISLPVLQHMLGMGDEFTSIAFRVAQEDSLPDTLAQVSRHISDSTIKVYPWQELIPEVAQMNAIFKGSLLIVMGIIFLTIAVVTMNTVLMSVLERTREFGTMLALGSKPRVIVRLVLLESAAIGIASSLVGLGIGSLAAYVHSITGMSMKAHKLTAIPGTTDMVYPQLTWATTLAPAALLPLIMILVSLYPAWRAGRMEPIKALRHV